MESNLNINFFGKIWNAIAKPGKYEDLRKLGLKKSITYIFSLVGIFALILAIIATLLQINIVNDAISYLDEKLPEFKFKDNKLSLDNSDATILDDEKIIGYIGNKIVVNPMVTKDKAIDLYKDLATEKNKVLIFLNEEYILISNEYNPNSEQNDGIEEKNYTDISSKYISDTTYEYTKKDIIEYLRERTSYTYYLAQYFIIYFGMIVFLYGIYIIIISFSLWLITKLSKFKWNLKDSIMNTIYASTLSMFVYVLYMIISYFTKYKIPYMDACCIFLIFIYLYLLVIKQKKEINN